jgi:hypothetical protein
LQVPPGYGAMMLAPIVEIRFDLDEGRGAMAIENFK